MSVGLIAYRRERPQCPLNNDVRDAAVDISIDCADSRVIDEVLGVLSLRPIGATAVMSVFTGEC